MTQRENSMLTFETNQVQGATNIIEKLVVRLRGLCTEIEPLTRIHPTSLCLSKRPNTG